MPPIDAMMTSVQERRRSSFTVAMVLTVAGPAPSVEELRARVTRRWRTVTRLRMRPVTDGTGRPRRPYRWSPDHDWDPAVHVAVTPVAPGGRLENLIEELIRPCLPDTPDGPLWQLHLVPNAGPNAHPGPVPGGRFALLLRAHHALVDMASLGALLRMLCDGPGALAPPPPVSAGAPPAGRELGAGGALGIVHALHGVARRAGRGGGGPGGRIVNDAARLVAWSSVPYELVDTARGALPEGRVTVNDVVLAAFAGALRATPQELDGHVRLDRVYAAVPVDLRGPAQRQALGNPLSGVRLRLPVWSGEPLARLRAVRREMTRNKASGRAGGGARVMAAATRLGGRGADAMGRFMYANPSIATVSCSNARLCEKPLLLDGAPVQALFGVSFLMPGVGVQAMLTTYDDTHTFCVTADGSRGPWLRPLADAFVAGVHELAALARTDGAPPEVPGGAPWSRTDRRVRRGPRG